MICPKCGHEQNEGRMECASCGIVFAKWEAYQKSLVEKETGNKQDNEPPPVETDLEDTEANEWILHWSRVAGWALIIGFIMPLLKRSMILDQSFLIWPWEIIGGPGNAGHAAAMGTAATRHYDAQWALLPLLLGVVILILRRFGSLITRGELLTGLGITALTLLMVFFINEAELLGIVFTPPTPEAGIMVMLAVGGAAMVVAANHAAKTDSTATLPRWITGIGGFILGAITLLFTLASSGVWNTWPMWLFYGLLGLVAVLGFKRGFDPMPDMESLARITWLARVTLVWGVVAMIIAQSTNDDGFARYVIQAGGGIGQTIMGIAKALLIYGGSALITTVGLAAMMQRRLVNNQSQSEVI